MSQHQFFRRSAVPAQVAQQLQTVTIPAPTRGLILNENETYMQPGGAVVMDNWKPTMRGASLRGGCSLWCQLPEATPVISAFSYVSSSVQKMFAGNATKLYDVTYSALTGVSSNWQNVTIYNVGDFATDTADGTIWRANITHISGAMPLTFAQFRTAIPAAWTKVQAPAAVKTGQTSGNYASAQMSNAGGDWMIVVNDAGDPPLRYNGTDWEVLINGYVPPAGKPSTIDVDLVAYPGATVDGGANLVYVCKYRGRLFFIEKNSMNAWYLPLNAVGGNLNMIPLSGAATKGGKLLFCAAWSIDAGDGIDDKLVFCTDLGELLIFTGSDPSVAANWRQEGRYEMSPPLGMNAHILVGGDLLIATVDGIIPTSGAITKDRAELELAAITRAIKPMWREEATAKRRYPWTMCKWDEYGGMFVTWPGGAPGKQLCAVVNQATTAWARFTGWDAMCFAKINGSMYFGTQTGQIMQADQTGKDNGAPYVATIVGGWEMFNATSQTVTWRQARASFFARPNEPYIPQLSATTDYVVTIPQPPPIGNDPGPLDLWDEGLWDFAKWDASAPVSRAQNTGWVSIGMTGYSHAPIVQVTVSQQAKPIVDLISIAATFERDAVVV